MATKLEVDKVRESMRCDKEVFWDVVNKIDETFYTILNDADRLEEYNRIYQPSLKIVHQMITKFCGNMNQFLEEIVEREDAKKVFMNHKGDAKPIQADNFDENMLAEMEEIADQSVENNSEHENDYLSDSEYTVAQHSTCVTILHKGFNYRSRKTKSSGKFDCPEGIYRCTRQGKKCTGTVEPIEKSNGKVHIRSVDPHSCSD